MQKAGGGIIAALACGVLLGGCSLKTEKLEELIPFGAKGLNGVTIEETFTESDRKLNNPNRGFYQLYEFLITDEGMDYREFIENWYPEISDISLMFIQINLQSYPKGEISQKGLDNIEELLTVLETYEKQLILRFVYDRKGKVKESEPESLEIILKHMEQLEDTLKKHHKQIFIVQGVFTGNWGEMNGSRHDTEENWRVLAGKLEQVTDHSTYLGVRTPAQWRSLISADQIPEGELPYKPEEFGMEGYSHVSPLWGRLGLFNDGMLGSESDYGTYGNRSASDSSWTEGWNREDELAFQKELCRVAPNGGETIVDNPYNDLPDALRDLSAMHVTYLNKWHDEAVLKKWSDTVMKEDGCFNGMDGYTYVERHLGYRLLIDRVQLNYKRRGARLQVNIKMRNVGFAPIYRNPELKLLIRKEGSEEAPQVYPIEGRLCCLAGGEEAETVLSLRKEISLEQLSEGRYGIYFTLVDPSSQTHIKLANQQNEEEYGYCLGFVQLSR